MWTLNSKQSSIWQLKQARAEKRTLRSFAPAYKVLPPKTLKSPLILASPHSGRRYPQSFLDQTSITLDQLRLSEDSYVDELIAPLSQHHIPVLHALFPRCYVDVNRGANEWPPETILTGSNIKSISPPHSPHAHAGLGVVPTRISHGVPIYKQPLTPKFIQSRLDTLYHPYHEALYQLIDRAKSQFGRAILLDFHSMPGTKVSGQKRADFILGDRFGKTCAADTINMLQELLRTRGYSVSQNIPYAGGFITGHYGRPDQQVEAVQIEINKDLYLNQDTFTPHLGMPKLIDDIKNVILNFDNALNTSIPIAAQ